MNLGGHGSVHQNLDEPGMDFGPKLLPEPVADLLNRFMAIGSTSKAVEEPSHKKLLILVQETERLNHASHEQFPYPKGNIQ